MKNRLELINQLCDILYQNSDRLMQIAEDAGKRTECTYNSLFAIKPRA